MRVMAIAIDAAERSMIAELIAAGEMPVMAEVIDRGASAVIEGPEGFLPGAAWPSLITGMPPSSHLLTFDRQLRPGTYRIENATPEELRRPPFWRYLSDAKVRSTVVSLYASPLLEDFEGTQVVGWGSYDPYNTKLGRPQFRPADVGEILERAAPGRRWGFLRGYPRSPEELSSYRDEALTNVRLQAEGLKAMSRQTEWDFFFGNFSEPHEAGHLLWPNDGSQDGRGDLLRDIYRALDRGVGEVLEAAPDDAVLTVLTPHGMGSHLQAYRVAEEVLKRGGWLAKGGPGGKDAGRRTLLGARRLAKAAVPLPLRRLMGRAFRGTREALVAAELLTGVDWDSTTVFPLPHDNVSLVRVNLKGREPSGTVTPGTHYRDMCAEVTRAFEQLVDAEGGVRVVQEVVAVADVIGHPVGDVLPDLAVVWHRTGAALLESPTLGQFVVSEDDPRTGDHEWPGFLLAAGRGITKGAASITGEPGFHRTDVAPTILGLLGLEPPKQFPGRPIEHLLPGSSSPQGIPADGSEGQSSGT